jgi:hypothetical protein
MINENNVIEQSGYFGNSNGSKTNIADSFASETVGFEQLSVANVAKSLTSTIYGDNTVKAVITVEGANLRVRTDGTAPDINVGLLISMGDCIELNSRQEVEGFRCIAPAGVAVLNIEYKA